MNKTQAMLNAFKQGKTLSILTAFKLCKSMKLSTRVNDTYEPMGYVFKRKMIYNKDSQYMEYTLDFKKTPKRLLK